MNDGKEFENKPVMKLLFPEEKENELQPEKDEIILFKISNIKLEDEENSPNLLEIKEIKTEKRTRRNKRKRN